jgi:hypothetical protein
VLDAASRTPTNLSPLQRLRFLGIPKTVWEHHFYHPAKCIHLAQCIAALKREALTGMSSATLDLARHLLACEAIAGKTYEPTEFAASRVYEKLRRPLCALAGVAGFRSLVARALTLAKPEAPSLSAVQVTPDGDLQGLGEFNPKIDKHQTDGGEVILIAQLLGLLHTFIGEPLTLRLVQDVWPDAAFDDAIPRTGEKHEHKR